MTCREKIVRREKENERKYCISENVLDKARLAKRRKKQSNHANKREKRWFIDDARVRIKL